MNNDNNNREDNKDVLLLGETDIREYVSYPSVSLSDDVFQKEFRKLIKQTNFAFEKKAVNEVISQLLSTKYPEIDLSFLEMYSAKYFGKEIESRGFLGLLKREKEIYIRVPRFAVYPSYENTFSIGNEGRDYRFLVFNERRKILPSIIEEKIAQSLGVTRMEEHHDVDGGRYYNVEPRLATLYYLNKQGFNTLSAEFNGLVPPIVKEKIEAARKYFHNFYFVREVKPEEWNLKNVFPKDPLVIGLKGNRAHLIAHFDTTPLEDAVKNIYNRTNMN